MTAKRKINYVELVVDFVKDKFGYKNFNYDLPPVSGKAKFNNDLDFESLEMMELGQLVEEEFDVDNVDPGDLVGFVTLNDLAGFIEKKNLQPA